MSCQTVLAGQAGAAAGTPVAGVWSEFVAAAAGTVHESDLAASQLAGALRLAAEAYVRADREAARALRSRR